MTRVTLYEGDCRFSLRLLSDCSIPALLTDLPYELGSMKARFSLPTAAEAKSEGNDGAFGRLSKNFIGINWDGNGISYDVEMWRELLRVLMPGAFALCFMGSRTYHRAACAAEDAGFIIHPLTGWVYGQGMSLAADMAKSIDKHMGVKGETLEDGTYVPASAEAVQWKGWRGGAGARRTALEPIIFAQKPISEKSVAANMLKWGVGALNIDGTRTPEGRHPANLWHDNSAEVLELFPQSAGQLAKASRSASDRQNGGIYGAMVAGSNGTEPRGDSGSAGRFFNSFEHGPEDIPGILYHQKARAEDRAGSLHPTAKPVALLRNMARMICPPGGTVLDPFAGSGTTGAAALLEGMSCILMEAEPEYNEFLRQRFNVNKRDEWAEMLGL